jgi:hypothetical protein
MESVVPYKLSFEERPDYLYAYIEAESIDRPVALEYLSEVARYCARIAAKRLMLHRDIPVMLPDADLFNTTTDFLEMIRGTRAAFVNPYQDLTEAFDFAMVVGLNRGADCKLFNTVEDAEIWLLEDTLDS